MVGWHHHDGHDGHEFEQALGVGDREWTRKPGMLQFMGLQRVWT